MGLDDWSLIPGKGRDFFYLPPCTHLLWGTPCLISNGYWESFPQGVKWPDHEADHFI